MKRYDIFGRFLLLLVALFFVSPLSAQWQSDMRLTLDDSSSSMSMNNARCIATGPNGVIHVVWFDDRDGLGAEAIFYKRSTDHGATWSQETRLSFSGSREWYPSICASGSDVHVVWFNGSDMGIRYKRSTDTGISWLPDTLISTRTTWTYAAGYPSITAAGAAVYAVWESGYQYLSCLYISLSRSTDSGASWSRDTALTDSTIMYNRSEMPSVSASGADVHVAWMDRRGGNNNIYYKRSVDLGLTWSPDSCLLEPYLAMNPTQAASDSLVHMVWWDAHNGGRIGYKRSTDHGMTWSPDVPISDTLRYAAWDPTVIAAGVNVHAVWEDYHGGWVNLHYKTSTDGGATWGPETLLTSDSTTWTGLYPSLAFRDTMLHLVWQDHRDGNYEVYYKRNPNGNASGIAENPKRIRRKLLPGLIATPNPFVSFTIIPGHEKERFVIYDIAGKRVRLSLGARVGENLSPGVYFLKPASGNYSPARLVKVQ